MLNLMMKNGEEFGDKFGEEFGDNVESDDEE